jgi:hypothetical protein
MRRSNIHPQTGLSNISSLLVVLGIVVVVLLSIYAAMWWSGGSPPLLTAKVPLTIEVAASPEDSEIFIDGKSVGTSKAPLAFPAGKHELLVSRPGYRPWRQSFEAAGSLKFPVTLQPIPMDLRILPGQEKAEVWLDDQPKAGSPDGSGAWTVTGVSRGTHSVRIKTAAGESTVSLDFRNGNPAAPVFPEGGPTILFVSSSDGKVRAECNCKAELQLSDSSQPLEPGSAATFTVAEGKYPAELKGLPAPQKTFEITVGPASETTMAFFWPAPVQEKKPILDIQSLLNKSVDLLKDSKCDAAQANIDQVLSKAPGNADALGISRRITRLRSVGGCR